MTYIEGGSVNKQPRLAAFAASALLSCITANVWAASSTVLYDFAGTPGCWPRSLMPASDGFYGATSGWTGNPGATVFRVSESGGGASVGPSLGFPPAADSYHLGKTSDGLSNEIIWGISGETIYKMTTSGERTTVHTFTGGTGGANPSGGLTLGKDDWLYGTTARGGDYNQGTAFRLSQDGRFRTIGSFRCDLNGCNPNNPLILGSDGALYGVSTTGGYVGTSGLTGQGAIFRITATRGIQVLHVYYNPGNLGGFGYQAAFPYGKLLEVDGYLYGVTTSGSWYGRGEFYRLKRDGTGYQPIYRPMEGSGALSAAGGFTRLKSGEIVNWGYWFTGENYESVVWKLNKSAHPVPIYKFRNSAAMVPVSELVESSDSGVLAVELGGFGSNCGRIHKVNF